MTQTYTISIDLSNPIVLAFMGFALIATVIIFVISIATFISTWRDINKRDRW